MSLAGKTLFITGASRGIGLAIGLRAARDGANVAIAAKTAEPHPKLAGTIYTAAEEIERAGGKALPLTVDVRDETMVKDALDQTAARFGGVDIVVNNASAIQLTPAVDTDMRRFDLMHQINTRGTFVVSKWAIPHLEKAANPHILMISPPLDMQEKWFARHTAYTMAKFGMSLVVLGLAGELRPKGIAVNALWPRTVIATAAVRNSARWRRHDARIAKAGDHGRRGLCHIPQARARVHRTLSDRRYFPGGERRQRFRSISGRPDAKAGARFLRAGRFFAAEGRELRGGGALNTVTRSGAYAASGFETSPCARSYARTSGCVRRT